MYTIDATRTIIALHQTGTDGNYAGHRKKLKGDTYINYGLAGKRFDYSLGHVSCGQFFTEGEKSSIKVLTRQHNGCERTFRKYHVSPYLSLKPQWRHLMLWYLLGLVMMCVAVVCCLAFCAHYVCSQDGKLEAEEDKVSLDRVSLLLRGRHRLARWHFTGECHNWDVVQLYTTAFQTPPPSAPCYV